MDFFKQELYTSKYTFYIHVFLYYLVLLLMTGSFFSQRYDIVGLNVVSVVLLFLSSLLNRDAAKIQRRL